MCASGLPFEAGAGMITVVSECRNRHLDGVLVPDRTGGMIQANQAASGEKDTE